MEKISAERDESPHFFEPHRHEYSISDNVALKVHSDTKPSNMKISNLQKGVILLCNGIEVVGEGTGFGVPIGKYSDETYFSGTSYLHVHEKDELVIIQKEFIMDLVARDKFRNLKLENTKMRKILNVVSLLYQKHKRLASLIRLTKILLFAVGIDTTFVRTEPKGKVVVTYTINRNRILVNLCFRKLDRNNLLKIFVLNEQGAGFFRKYSDSEGLNLGDDEIGVWDHVTAKTATIIDKHDRIGFTLNNIGGTKLRRGREVAKGSLDWIGLDYELSSKEDQFEYEIVVYC